MSLNQSDFEHKELHGQNLLPCNLKTLRMFQSVSYTHLCDDQFDGFERGERVKTTYVCFTEYDVTIENKPVSYTHLDVYKRQELS